MAVPANRNPIRFGVFEVDLNSGELRKHGVKIKLHDQPFKILTILLEHPGEVVTREQLCERLWPSGTFVDSEAGLNSAIKRIRIALGDSAEHPRFVETLPRRGYRLIVEAEPVASHVDAELPSASLTPGSLDREIYNGVRATAEKSVAISDSTPVPPRSRPRIIMQRGLMIVAVLSILGASAWWWAMRPTLKPYSIAVIPLQNLSPDAGSDYFSDGLTDEIIHNLAIIEGLEVKSRTSSFAFKGAQRDVHQVGAQLQANLILEGSVLRDGDRLRVNIQLVRVKDDYPLWSGEYNREVKDIFAIQDDISRSVVNELRLKLGRGQRRYNTNLDAYDDYLHAKVLLDSSLPGAGSDTIAESIPLFRGAIEKDPNFAPAYAGIATAYAYLSSTPRTFSAESAYPKMKETCERAVQLDPLLADAHACMGLVYSRGYAWADAEKSFHRALELDPNLSRSREDLAIWVLTPEGKVDEALTQLHAALKLDPLSSTAQYFLNFVLLIAGHNDEVLANSPSTLASDPNTYGALQLSARALVQKGRTAEGIAILEKLGKGSEAFLGYAYAKAGRSDDARGLIREHMDFPWLKAVVYGGLGDKDRAVEGLEQMIEIRDPRVGNYLQFPELSLLRGDQRLAEIRKRLDLPTLP